MKLLLCVNRHNFVFIDPVSHGLSSVGQTDIEYDDRVQDGTLEYHW